MRLTPTSNRVILRLDANLPASAIIASPTAECDQYSPTGTVIATGPQCVHLAVGDRVLWNPCCAGQLRFSAGTVRYVLLREVETQPLDPITVYGFVEDEARRP